MAKHRMRDLVVVLPGITGSVLSERRGTEWTPLWNLSGGAVWQYLKSHGGSLQSLALDAHDPRTVVPVGSIDATGLISGFHGVFGLAKIDGYADMINEISKRFDVTVGRWDDDQPANLVPFPYDWRLSSRTSADRLEKVVTRKLDAWRSSENDPEAKVILLAHSMGGLVARYWLEVLGGWERCRALVTFGTPFQGSLDSVGYVANGYKKAFIDLGDVLRSCPSVYELMPVYRAVNRDGSWLRPCDVTIPHAVDDYVRAGADFHDEMKKAHASNTTNQKYLDAGYAVVPFIGVHQSTNQSAMLTDGGLMVQRASPDWMDPDLDGGDGTVPRAAASPEETDSNPFGASFMGEQHGSLQNNFYALDDLIERMKQSQARHIRELQGSWSTRARAIDLIVDDLVLPDEEVTITARGITSDGASTIDIGLQALVTLETDGEFVPRTITLSEGVDALHATLEGLCPGRYRVTVGALQNVPAPPLPVTGVFEVAG
jgi:pimeloyl-ACP methyl ester carboxylesterase